MRNLGRTWRAVAGWAAAASVAGALLSGCSTGSITPGIGGSGGLGTPGTGTGNPDGAMVFLLRGVNTGDFKASELKTQMTFLGFTIQGIVESGTSKQRLTRVTTVRFPGLPVAGRTYTLTPHSDGDGTSEEEHAVLQYSEQRSNQQQFQVWSASKGTVRVRRVTPDVVEGTFEGTLEPATAAAKGTLTVTKGEFRAKYHIVEDD